MRGREPGSAAKARLTKADLLANITPRHRRLAMAVRRGVRGVEQDPGMGLSRRPMMAGGWDRGNGYDELCATHGTAWHGNRV
jgi:hypothetical protein